MIVDIDVFYLRPLANIIHPSIPDDGHLLGTKSNESCHFYTEDIIFYVKERSNNVLYNKVWHWANITFLHVTIEWLLRSLYIQVYHGCNGGYVRGDTYRDKSLLSEVTEKIVYTGSQRVYQSTGDAYSSGHLIPPLVFTGVGLCLH